MKLVEHVGGLFERRPQFVELLGGIDVRLGLELFHNRCGIVNVTREVVQQASGAVSAGVESLKDLGENLADRVPDRFKTPF